MRQPFQFLCAAHPCTRKAHDIVYAKTGTTESAALYCYEHIPGATGDVTRLARTRDLEVAIFNELDDQEHLITVFPFCDISTSLFTQGLHVAQLNTLLEKGELYIGPLHFVLTLAHGKRAQTKGAKKSLEPTPQGTTR
jgi:hypothetical protein